MSARTLCIIKTSIQVLILVYYLFLSNPGKKANKLSFFAQIFLPLTSFFYISPFPYRFFLHPPPLPQQHIQLIHHLRPIRIIQNLLTQQLCLALVPEERVRQVQFGFER